MIYNYQNILTIYQKHINILFDKFLLHIKRKERIMEWIQEGTNSLDMMDVKMCPCMGLNAEENVRLMVYAQCI